MFSHPRRAAKPSIDCRLDDRVAVCGVSKIHYEPTIRLWPIDAFHPRRHVLPPPPPGVIGDDERLFSRTIDPLGGTFAINELLPVADTVQLPPADAFPQVPTRFVRSWGELRPWAKPRTWAPTRGKHLLPRFGASQQERGEHTGCMFQHEEYAGDQRYTLCIMLTLRARARE